MTNRRRPKEKRKVRCGMTVEWYDEKLATQDGGCAICSRRPARIRLAVDHDHLSGVIRGLLCYICNRKVVGVIEKFKIDPRKIVAYLQQYGSGRLAIPAKPPQKV